MKHYALFSLLFLSQALLSNLAYGGSLSNYYSEIGDNSICSGYQCNMYDFDSRGTNLMETQPDSLAVYKTWFNILENFAKGNGVNPPPQDLSYYYEHTPLKLRMLNDHAYFSLELNYRF